MVICTLCDYLNFLCLQNFSLCFISVCNHTVVGMLLTSFGLGFKTTLSTVRNSTPHTPGELEGTDSCRQHGSGERRATDGTHGARRVWQIQGTQGHRGRGWRGEEDEVPGHSLQEVQHKITGRN